MRMLNSMVTGVIPDIQKQASSQAGTTRLETGQAAHQNAGIERDLELSGYQLTASLQWNLTEKQAVYGGIGLEVGREIEIKNDQGGVLYKKDLKTAPLFELGYRFRF